MFYLLLFMFNLFTAIFHSHNQIGYEQESKAKNGTKNNKRIID